MERVNLQRITPFQKKRQERNKKLLAEYNKLIADPEQSRMEIMKYLTVKYGFVAPTSIYKILKKELTKEGGRQ